MRGRILSLLAALLVAVPLRAQIDDAVLRLIGPDARWVLGAKLDHYHGATLEKVYPAALGWFELGPSLSPDAQVTRIYAVQGADKQSAITIIEGSLDSPPFEWEQPQQGYAVLMLNRQLAVAGDQQAAAGASRRWADDAGEVTPLAPRLRAIEADHDLWFLASGSLGALVTELDPVYRFASALLNRVTEVRGGAKLGEIYQLRLEIDTQDEVTAAALANFAPWLPAAVQLGEDSVETRILGMIENIEATTEGTTVIVRGTLPDAKLRTLMPGAPLPAQ